MKKIIVMCCLVSLSGYSIAQKIKMDNDAKISEGVTSQQIQALVTLIRINGYSCNSVSAVTPFAFSNGWHVYCNNWNYGFEVEDQGGKFKVSPK